MAPHRGLFHDMTQHDLLIDEECLVWAVNCRVEGDTLHCGALYLEPLVQHHRIRLAYDGATIEVELPPELVRQSNPYKGWDIQLRINDEQVQRTPLSS